MSRLVTVTLSIRATILCLSVVLRSLISLSPHPSLFPSTLLGALTVSCQKRCERRILTFGQNRLRQYPQTDPLYLWHIWRRSQQSSRLYNSVVKSGMHKFHNNLGFASKFSAPEAWQSTFHSQERHTLGAKPQNLFDRDLYTHGQNYRYSPTWEISILRNFEQERKCTYNATRKFVRVIIIDVEQQQVLNILSVHL